MSADQGQPAVTIDRVDPTEADLVALIDQHQAASRLHYDVADRHALAGDDLAEAGTIMFAARLAGIVVGICGLKPLGGGSAELKSMYLAEAARGCGVARLLLDHVLDHGRAEGFREVLLEAGRSDAYAAPARALYLGAGFEECPPFGSYTARPASIFLRRDL